ncbi:putative ribonuclease H-like domain-containing protein [Rosa chinensis]|uniref:Putative ribonuclease H-like domain-containing protein n=1 Tax=Rosa chinensis TaxID=74649 RepID=A0A2P6PF47_ROSCH|nr:putative ribonuclease H-like domain-containing protein [Rosa chinensis]
MRDVSSVMRKRRRLNMLVEIALLSKRLYVYARALKCRKAAREARPWSPPPIGWVKANLDGAFDQHTNCGGLGVIIRDSSGLITGGCCRKVSHVTTPAMVESLAARLACQFAVSHSLAPIIFETDCQKLVKDIMSDEEDASGYGRIVEDISFFQASLPSSYFTHVFRESNSAAHMLAKLALNSSIDLAWRGQIPSSISNYVANHCMN